MLSAILFSVTIFFSVIIQIMLRGKNFVNLTAKGAGRINPQEGGNNRQEQQTAKEINATIYYTYPFYNIAGVTTLWNTCNSNFKVSWIRKHEMI